MATAPNPVMAAKNALASANKKFPSSMAKDAGVTPAANRAKPTVAPKPTGAAQPAGSGLGEELREKASDVKQFNENYPKFHKGGTVPGKPGEEVPIMAEAGEKVIPASDNGAAVGRNSDYRKAYIARRQNPQGGEYRKVFIARRQARQGGGNKPVTGEMHDTSKAVKGQPSAKEAGAHVKV